MSFESLKTYSFDDNLTRVPHLESPSMEWYSSDQILLASDPIKNCLNFGMYREPFRKRNRQAISSDILLRPLNPRTCSARSSVSTLL